MPNPRHLDMDAPHPLDQLHVLGSRPLRPGLQPSDISTFSADVWDLTPATFQPQQAAIRLDFNTITPRHRLLAKELFFALLTGPPPARERGLLKVTTLVTMFATIRSFLDWLANYQADVTHDEHTGVSMLTPGDLLAYQQHLLTTSRNCAARDNCRSAVRYFWRYRGAAIHDRLSFDPHRIVGWGESGARHRTENSTDRIPEQVLGPLLAWSLRFVDDFAADIINADREWRRIRLGEGRVESVDRYHAGDAIKELLARYREENRPLPGIRGRPNRGHLGALIGCHRSTLREYWPAILETAAAVGVTDKIALDITIGGELSSQPWTDMITTDRTDRQAGSFNLVVLLTAACYVVIAYLSGMRDSEIKGLRRNSVSIKQDSLGNTYRWMLTSRSFKGEHSPAGAEATWVVGAPVARAIRVLEDLQPDDEPRLFAPPTQSPAVGQGVVANYVTLTTTTNRHLNELTRWINAYCHEHGRDDIIPQVNARTWQLTTRQFRRTLAWFIARQPGGAIAGAIAYRHQSIQMFEGYAGTSDSGFRAEVESEMALSRGEHLLSMTDAHDHLTLSGPAAAEARNRLNEFEKAMHFQGKTITDNKRYLRLLRRHDPAIYPGRYATCVFDPDKALCTRTRDTHGQLTPTLGDCQPLDCRNVALTENNTTELQSALHDLERQLRERPTLPPLLHQRLQVRRNQIHQFLTRHAAP
jgi:hypothetical protein